jgi:hypothetical protein
VKLQCEICGRKEYRHEDYGYRVGYYEEDIRVGGRNATYKVCTKCNRCIIVENDHTWKTYRKGKSTYLPE